MTDLFPAVRSALADAARTNARRRRRRRRLPGAAAAVVVVVVVAALAIGLPSDDVDVVARAQAALAATPNEIVHTIVTQTSQTPQTPAGKARTDTIEQWGTISPTRGRIWFRPSSAPVGGAQRTYSQQPGGPRAHAPNADPVSAIRALIDQGLLRDVGEAVVAGRTIRRLQGHSDSEHDSSDITYDVDPDSYEPLRAVQRITPRLHGTGRTADTLTVTTRFDLIERLPLTPENERLLEVQPAPDSAG